MIDKEKLYGYCAELGLEMSESQLLAFDSFSEWLADWNTKINLTAITSPDDILVKHFIDSLAVLYAAPLKEGSCFIDVGTGGGFPGLPLLIARPDLHGVLLDSTLKKLLFVDRVINGLEMQKRARTLHMRAEEAGIKLQLRGHFDYSVSRAVANLRELSEYCLPLTKIGGAFVSLKGSKADEELEEAKGAIKLLGGEVSEIRRLRLPDGSERSIIVISKVAPTPPKYPRTRAKMLKEPLK